MSFIDPAHARLLPCTCSFLSVILLDMFVKLALTLRSTLDPSFDFVDAMANLASIGRDRYVSQSGLAAILKEIQTHGLPENISRSAVKRSREQDLKGMQNEYGEIIIEHKFDMVNSTKQESFHFVNPWCFLQHILTNSEPFKGYFTKYLLALGHENTRPLRISVYCDEVTPGNQLRHDPTRKIQIIKGSLVEKLPSYGDCKESSTVTLQVAVQ